MPSSSQSFRRRTARRGFTLLEIMVATVVTLLMMVSLVQVFKIIGDSMKQGRAALAMNNTLRAVTYRLRNDLANLTVRVDPPASSATGAGYLEYTDGPMTDYTASLFDQLNDTSSPPEFPTQVNRSSRYGDCDDILMFTSRASAGAWFTGRAPANVVNSAAGTNTTPVTIASQLAEIIVFARPVSTNLTVAGGLFDDVDGNFLPDSYNLYYRALLVRPDLNTFAFNGGLVLPNLTVGTANQNATPLEMAPAFQTCDLSMHRVYDGDRTTVDHVRANSLEDLMDPANRFAHFQFAVPDASTTMPLLVMDPIPQVGTVAGSAIKVFSDDGNNATKSPLLSEFPPLPATLYRGNFLNSAFTLQGARLGEDILMNNVLAFDVKAFDIGAPVIGVGGADNTWQSGADGTDDVVLTPNDPGFGYAYSTAGVQSLYTGTYVDLLWGRKVLCSLPYYGLDYNSIRSNTSLNLRTGLSGIDALSASAIPTVTYSDGLYRSGKYISSLGVLQATYDTWTTRYESDGRLQAVINNTAAAVVDVDNWNRMNALTSNTSDASNALPAYRVNAFDAGTDGIDNNGTNGVDELQERETLPPFPVRLPGLKISIRAEDQPTRQVRQMSVISEFVTQ